MTDKYAVVGNPVAHSISPQIHAEFARQTDAPISYVPILAPLDGFAAAVSKFRDEGGKGMNVTLPFKEEAFQISTTRSIRANSARAVNTLSFGPDAIAGDNTDGIGLVTDLKLNLQFEIRGRRVLLMGAGGASHGVLLPLLIEEPVALTIVNRTLVKALQLRDELQGEREVAVFAGLGKRATDMEVVEYPDLKGRCFDLVINATSSGLKDEMPPLPRGIFAAGALAYDMVYGKHTPFMKFAAEHGAKISDGIGMLVEQAAESFLIWRGVRPVTAPVIAMLKGVNSES